MKKALKKLDNKGFTLVELIIVIAIIAVLAAVIAPQYINYVARSRQTTDANAMNEIAHAAEVAMVGNGTTVPTQTKFTVTTSATGITYQADNDLATAVKAVVPEGNYGFKSTDYIGKTFTVEVSTAGTANWFVGTTANTTFPSKGTPTDK